MLKDLCTSGIYTTLRRFAIKDIINMCITHNVATVKTGLILKEGWLGKPKKLLQVSFERGYIDRTKVENSSPIRYSWEGGK